MYAFIERVRISLVEMNREVLKCVAVLLVPYCTLLLSPSFYCSRVKRSELGLLYARTYFPLHTSRSYFRKVSLSLWSIEISALSQMRSSEWNFFLSSNARQLIRGVYYSYNYRATRSTRVRAESLFGDEN